MLFEETEGIDIGPAAAVAAACLQQAVAACRVSADARILLNVTGGGRRRLPHGNKLRHGESSVWLVDRGSSSEQIAAKILGFVLIPDVARCWRSSTTTEFGEYRCLLPGPVVGA